MLTAYKRLPESEEYAIATIDPPAFSAVEPNRRGPPVPALIMRVQCFQKAAMRLGMRVAAKQDNVKDTADGAQPIVADMLTAHPDVDFLPND